jgi:choline dehydrogenase-like flavoprotein
MGTPADDALVVVDERDLRVVGTRGLVVCDASLMPLLPTVNPMLTVLAVAERAADLLADEAYGHARELPSWSE